ncbi:MAG: 16S rRNA (cytosine(1402)-N(4))-methyltransferase RsmH [Promicromonosporaceae bacterium]|nr:16S rRNA (cytosine(1402)-N(4))-methyltransferase RsmH [Promicromonosporaceae bacterium]
MANPAPEHQPDISATPGSAKGPLTPEHLPVLAQRCVDLLAPALAVPGAVLIDGTVGLGGHTELVLSHIPEVTVIGIDRDTTALSLATARLGAFGDRFIPVHANYAEIPQVLVQLGIEQVQGILLDLGVSSMQLDQAERGFSYMQDAPLDMRMNQTDGITAAVVVNTYGQAELARILAEYGEEKFARRIAARIVEQRERAPLATTGELVELVQRAIPRKAQTGSGHLAKRTFQALRVEVNDELGKLALAVPAALATLAVGGRMVVEAYHSLEDRLVKRAFAAGLTSSAPVDIPVVPLEQTPYLKALTRGAELASPEEIATNPRAASVRLRAVEKIR